MKSRYTHFLGLLVLSTVLLVLPEISRAGDSDLDPTFGTGGLAQVTVGTTAGGGSKIALQSDGKIVQVGSSMDSYTNYGSDIAVVRYNTNGSLDTSFGTGGVVKTDMLLDEGASAVVIQGDGKIVAGGRTRANTTDNLGWDAALIRYNTDGTLDTAFDSSGKVVVDLGSVEAINDIALQSNGKIVAVGTTLSGGNNRFLVMRFNADGSLDTNFGTSGYLVEHFTENTLEDAYSVAILDDDSLIVAGRGIKPDGYSSISLLKLTAGGALDTGFSGDGRLAVTFGNSSGASSVAVDSEGRFVVGGYRRVSSTSDYEFLLLRYTAAGTLDPDFGTGGQVVTPFGAPYTNQQISSLALQDDGKIVVAGNGYIPATYYYDLLLARYHADGSLDTDFDGDDGKIALSQNSQIFPRKTLLQPDGKILVGGSVGMSMLKPFAVFRFGADLPGLTMAVNPAGGGTTTPAVGTIGVPLDVAQNITATANSGYNFVNWSVSGDATIDNPQAQATTVTLTGNATVTANFCMITTWYFDGDDDGYGNPAGPTISQCGQPAGYVADNTDCNDANAAINPGATEVCDNIDNNCDGQVDEGLPTTTWWPDGDGDGYGDPAGSSLDQCGQPDGYVANNTDCNDASAAVNPGATEVCDGIDNNCDGQVDEGLETFTWYPDGDGDGYGDPAGSTLEQCGQPTGYVADSTDCNDANPLEFPGQTWYKDEDGDGFSDGTTIVACARPAGYFVAAELKATSGDPDDTDPNKIPDDFAWELFLPAIINNKQP